MRNILVVGYPRSGNTWLSRLLGDYLNSPVGGLSGEVPLATEGKDRPGDYMIAQMHLVPCVSDKNAMITSKYEFNISRWDGTSIIHMIRDPRDIAVSAMHYWQMKNLLEVVEYMGMGTGPLDAIGSWSDFVLKWTALPFVSQVRYEGLLTGGPLYFCGSVLKPLRIMRPEEKTNDRVHQVFGRQEFSERRAQIERDGDTMEYGKEIQLRSMRYGKLGGWRRFFTRKIGKIADGYFGPAARFLGYDMPAGWYKHIKD